MRRLIFVAAYAACLCFPISLSTAQSPIEWNEEQWTQYVAKKIGGQTGVVLHDRTKPDIVTKDVAYEVEFIDKYKESLTQAIHYGQMIGKRPGIIYLLRGDKASIVRFSNRAMIPVSYVRGLGGKIDVIWIDARTIPVN